MIRAVLLIVLALAVAVVVLTLRGEPGAAEIDWLGWQVRTTAAAAALIVLLVTLAAALLWRVLIWAAEAPRRSERARAEARRRQATDALTRGFVAVAGGDGTEAKRQAARAASFAEETPTLVRLLAAEAAEAADDPAAARGAYQAMLGFPELRLVAHRALRQAALAEGDAAAAETHARAAYALSRTASWAWRAVLEDRLAAGDWRGALEAVDGAAARKSAPQPTAERARAALLTAAAASREADAEPNARAEALEDAQGAARLRHDFAPAAVVAARLLAADGRIARAAQVIEAAWKARPHPALWLAYRDLRTDETPSERAGRLASLAAFHPDARESRILAAEQALVAKDVAGARAAAESLAAEPLTRRLAGLFARIAASAGDADEARALAVRGAEAPREPDWSDIAPDGRAFAYGPADWASVARRYAETGELAHPRFDRGAPGMGDLPDLPPGYVESAAFASAAETGLAPIIDAEDFGEEAPQPPPPPAPRRAARPRPKLPVLSGRGGPKTGP